MDYFQRIANLRKGMHREELHGFRYYRMEGILLPIHDAACDIGFAGSLADDFLKARQEFQNLRRAIVDDRLPADEQPLCVPEYWGGRSYFAMLLGKLGDPRACPELLEAAMHDSGGDMRATSAGSLGRIGKEASAYAPGLAQILLHDKDPFVAFNCAQSLGWIGNPSVSHALYDAVDEFAYRTVNALKDGLPALWDMRKRKLHMDYLLLTYQESLESLMRLDPSLGRQAFYRHMLDDNPLHHHFKNAAASFREFDHIFWNKTRLISTQKC